jgi:hypothetical protein
MDILRPLGHFPLFQASNIPVFQGFGHRWGNTKLATGGLPAFFFFSLFFLNFRKRADSKSGACRLLRRTRVPPASAASAAVDSTVSRQRHKKPLFARKKCFCRSARWGKTVESVLKQSRLFAERLVDAVKKRRRKAASGPAEIRCVRRQAWLAIPEFPVMVLCVGRGYSPARHGADAQVSALFTVVHTVIYPAAAASFRRETDNPAGRLWKTAVA